jgi:hypothetical protein
MSLAHFGSCTIPKRLQPNIRCQPWLTPNIELVIFGGADRDRTGGLLVANQALSQLSYSPNRSFQVPHFQVRADRVIRGLRLET